MDQTRKMHSVDTRGLFMPFLSCHFPKQYEMCFNPLHYWLIVNSIKASFAQQSIFTTHTASHMKNDQCRHMFFPRIICSGWFNQQQKLNR